jgi:hypothetical protein
MISAVQPVQWWVIYVNGTPAMLLSTDMGATPEKVDEGIRSMMLGVYPEGTTLTMKTVHEAPAEDVMRVGVLAIMGMLQSMMGAAMSPLRKH